jgi:hypothetical protein
MQAYAFSAAGAMMAKKTNTDNKKSPKRQQRAPKAAKRGVMLQGFLQPMTTLQKQCIDS